MRVRRAEGVVGDVGGRSEMLGEAHRALFGVDDRRDGEAAAGAERELVGRELLAEERGRRRGSWSDWARERWEKKKAGPTARREAARAVPKGDGTRRCAR